MLTPAVVHALVAAGATAAMLAAAFEVDYNERHGGTHETRSETLHETVKQFPTVSPQTSTERVRKHRAAKAMKRATVSTGVSSVSPLSLDLSLIGNSNSNDGRVPVAADWQPDGQSRAIAVKEGQDPDALSANFRDHYAARPHDMRAPAEWQATYRKWARSERKGAGSAQGRLPLVRRAGGGTSTIWRTQQTIEQTLQRRESG